MWIKILSAPFLAYLLSMFTVAIVGVKNITPYTGNTVEELWLAWIVLLFLFYLTKHVFRVKLAFFRRHTHD